MIFMHSAEMKVWIITLEFVLKKVLCIKTSEMECIVSINKETKGVDMREIEKAADKKKWQKTYNGPRKWYVW